MLTTLLKLGLSEKEAQVYLAALELGQDTVQNIAKKAKVNRATTYVILDKLHKLGLVSTQNTEKKHLFIAENPEELNNLLDLQQRQIEDRKKELTTVTPELMAIYNANKTKPSVRYFEGGDGLESLDRHGYEFLKPGTEVLSMIPIDIIEDEFPQRRQAALDKRVSLGLKARSLYTHRKGEIPSPVNDKELRIGIYLPREELPITATIQVFPEWGVKFFNFDKKNYFGVLVESAQIAQNMAELFKLAWEGAEARRQKKESKNK